LKRQQGAWIGIRAFGALARCLPHESAVRLGGGLGLLAWLLSWKKVDAAERRCVRVLGVGVSEARRIVRESYKNHGRCAAEILRMEVMGGLMKDLFAIHGEENLREAYGKGKGVILLSAHLGNWELAASRVTRMGIPVEAIGAEQRDPRMTDLLFSLRASGGVTTIGKGLDLKGALRCLQGGKALAVLLDQDAKRKGVVVPFMGRPASTPYGPVKMSWKLGAPIVPVFCIRREDGFHFDLTFLPALELPAEDGGEEAVKAAAKACNDVLGEWIARFPGQWMWLYPRWASTVGD
jgi:lauroyl/myristoyl acyltransferase